MMYAETGRYPLSVAINYQIIKYWLKILNSPDTSSYCENSLRRINEGTREASMDQPCEALAVLMWIR